MIIAKNSGDMQKFPLPEAGTVQAVCCGVWNIGLQAGSFAGKETIKHKIVVAWELSELINAPESEFNGKPYMLSKTYTLSLNEQANLRKDLESWRGKPFTAEEIENGFDVEKLYGVNCYLGVRHDASKTDASKIYANVSAILPLPKGVEKLIPLRTKEETAPKWVLDKASKAVQPEDVEPDFPDFSDMPPTTDEEGIPY